jgi:hypothetical protein
MLSVELGEFFDILETKKRLHMLKHSRTIRMTLLYVFILSALTGVLFFNLVILAVSLVLLVISLGLYVVELRGMIEGYRRKIYEYDRYGYPLL